MMDRLRTVAFSTLLWVIATVMNSTLAFSTLLYGIAIAMKLAAWRHPAFRERLKEHDVVGQIRVKAGTGRYFVIKNGKVTSRHGIHPNPDVVVTVKSAQPTSQTPPNSVASV